MEFLKIFTDVNSEWMYIIRILIACLCGGAIGIERTLRQKDAGFRTHVIVALGAALIIIVSKYGFFDILQFEGLRADASRIASNVVTGISFLGAGMIFVKGTNIKGLTTAAGLWAVGALGLALGIGFYEGALVAFLLFVLTVSILQKIENRLYSKPSHDFLYIEIKGDCAVSELLSLLRTTYQASELNVTPPRSGKNGNVGIEGIVPIEKLNLSMDEVVTALNSLECVVYILE